VTGEPVGIVLDASAMVDLLVGRDSGSIRDRLGVCAVHVPAHFDAEVLSALGRLHRAGDLPTDEADELVATVARAPFTRHTLADFLTGAWGRREALRVVDALYVELAERLRVPLLTSDVRLASAYPGAQSP
jgi:predicted nucleic acid-binding protein